MSPKPLPSETSAATGFGNASRVRSSTPSTCSMSVPADERVAMMVCQFPSTTLAPAALDVSTLERSFSRPNATWSPKRCTPAPVSIVPPLTSPQPTHEERSRPLGLSHVEVERISKAIVKAPRSFGRAKVALDDAPSNMKDDLMASYVTAVNDSATRATV